MGWASVTSTKEFFFLLKKFGYFTLEKDCIYHLGNRRSDKDHGVPNVPTELITLFKPKKIQQAFILHLQNWIGSVQPLFHVLPADSIEKGQFGASEVHICMVEVADEVVINCT